MKVSRTTLQMSLAVIAVLGFCLGQAQAADTEAPKIQFSEIAHDFGKSAPNQELKHSFTFKNTGKAMLIIQDVKAG